MIIKSMPTILEKNNNAHLVIAGNDENNYKTYLKKLSKCFDLKYFDNDSINSSYRDTKITFTGYLNNTDKKKAMVDSKLFLLSSHSENFGMTVIEAMACKLPVLISKNVGISDKVIEYNAGVVFKNNIPDAVINILENKSKADLLVMNAHRLLKEQYDIKGISKEIIMKFERIIKNN